MSSPEINATDVREKDQDSAPEAPERPVISRREVILVGLAAATVAGPAEAAPGGAGAAGASAEMNRARAPESGMSPWGYQTYKEPTPRPPSVRPGEQKLPTHPRKYTDIKSYHAHIYF